MGHRRSLLDGSRGRALVRGRGAPSHHDLELLLGSEELDVLGKDLFSVDQNGETGGTSVADLCTDSTKTLACREHLTLSSQAISQVNLVTAVNEDLLVKGIEVLMVSRGIARSRRGVVFRTEFARDLD